MADPLTLYANTLFQVKNTLTIAAVKSQSNPDYLKSEKWQKVLPKIKEKLLNLATDQPSYPLPLKKLEDLTTFQKVKTVLNDIDWTYSRVIETTRTSSLPPLLSKYPKTFLLLYLALSSIQRGEYGEKIRKAFVNKDPILTPNTLLKIFTCFVAHENLTPEVEIEIPLYQLPSLRGLYLRNLEDYVFDSTPAPIEPFEHFSSLVNTYRDLDQSDEDDQLALLLTLFEACAPTHRREVTRILMQLPCPTLHYSSRKKWEEQIQKILDNSGFPNAAYFLRSLSIRPKADLKYLQNQADALIVKLYRNFIGNPKFSPDPDVADALFTVFPLINKHKMLWEECNQLLLKRWLYKREFEEGLCHLEHMHSTCSLLSNNYEEIVFSLITGFKDKIYSHLEERLKRSFDSNQEEFSESLALFHRVLLLIQFNKQPGESAYQDLLQKAQDPYLSYSHEQLVQLKTSPCFFFQGTEPDAENDALHKIDFTTLSPYAPLVIKHHLIFHCLYYTLEEMRTGVQGEKNKQAYLEKNLNIIKNSLLSNPDIHILDLSNEDLLQLIDAYDSLLKSDETKIALLLMTMERVLKNGNFYKESSKLLKELPCPPLTSPLRKIWESGVEEVEAIFLSQMDRCKAPANFLLEISKKPHAKSYVQRRAASLFHAIQNSLSGTPSNYYLAKNADALFSLLPLLSNTETWHECNAKLISKWIDIQKFQEASIHLKRTYSYFGTLPAAYQRPISLFFAYVDNAVYDYFNSLVGPGIDQTLEDFKRIPLLDETLKAKWDELRLKWIEDAQKKGFTYVAKTLCTMQPTDL